jgi:hypothetical protein
MIALRTAPVAGAPEDNRTEIGLLPVGRSRNTKRIGAVGKLIERHGESVGDALADDKIGPANGLAEWPKPIYISDANEVVHIDPFGRASHDMNEKKPKAKRGCLYILD